MKLKKKTNLDFYEGGSKHKRNLHNIVTHFMQSPVLPHLSFNLFPSLSLDR